MATYGDGDRDGDIGLSLEDIIKKKKNQPTPRIFNKPQQNQIVDARQMIMSKKRIQITDAREILADFAKQKDARLKLQQLRAKRMNQATNKIQSGNVMKYHGKPVSFKKRERMFIDPSRQVISQPAAAVNRNLSFRNAGNQIIENQSYEANIPFLKPIVRTVENDLQIIDETMEEEYTPPPPKQTVFNRHVSLQLKITARNRDVSNRSPVAHRITTVEKARSPPHPPFMVKRPMAALRSEERTPKTVLEYRIIVSNLRNTVTNGDIEELFGDIGGMLESRLVRPGTAEVIYKGLDDAQKAVDLYHNRQLDGQPMNCLLVTPRTSTANSTKINNNPTSYSTSSTVEPDISTFHKVMFSNF